jgi:hypothetical protein
MIHERLGTPTKDMQWAPPSEAHRHFKRGGHAFDAFDAFLSIEERASLCGFEFGGGIALRA